MYARMRLAIGGAATVAASVAVVCAVALTNSAALADSAGRVVPLARIDVPLARADVPLARIGVPAATPSVPPAPLALPSPRASLTPATETLPAPAPQDVAPETRTVSPVAAPGDPHPEPSSAAVDPNEQDFLAGAAAAGEWDRALEWAHSRGWSDADIARWVARNPELIAELKAHPHAAQTPARGAGTPTVGDVSPDGSKRDQSPSSPDRRG